MACAQMRNEATRSSARPSWLLWNLTGGVDGGKHVTDVTNASRTMLMDLETLDWDDELLSFFGIPRQMLPAIVPSVTRDGFGETRSESPLGAELDYRRGRPAGRDGGPGLPCSG